VVERYRELLGQSGRATFAEIAATAGRALQRVAAPADHVVIDEAQDLNGGHWRLLRGLAAEGPDDLFICEDSHQRIYGEKIVLGQFGIAIRGRSRRLTLNYRTTRQNLNYAVGILAGAEITDLEGSDENTHGYRSSLSGPIPRVIAASNMDGEAHAIAETLSLWSKENDAEPEAFAILVRDRGRRDRIVRDLAGLGVSLQVIEGAAQPIVGKPQIMTMHRAKGLEFRRVILAGVSGTAFSISGPGGAMSEDDPRDAAARQRMLLYVAATRARDELVVTSSGTASELLPKNGSC
jgi:superfamily I DNA/RNA helicase